MFERLAIVNRGEPAVRFIRAVHEWNRQHDSHLRTIAMHTPAERKAMFVRDADEAVVITARPGGPAIPYLDLEVLADALVRARADAVWVGWGFVAERPEFADLCEQLGIVFLGPSAAVMRRLGDKIGSKLLAEQAGVPVATWSDGPVDTIEEALHHGRRIGFPLMVKATAGGGGRGIRLVLDEAGLPAAFDSARGEALRSFGDATVFLESLVDDARHVEVQIVADNFDNVWALGVRDCSVQRRRQKVLEESASIALDPDHERLLRESAVALARLAGYRSAGTVEFLYQPQSGLTAFLEVNTRLQVEHTVTEEATGVDIVKLQIHIAAGGRLDGAAPPPRGHAIEARLNAEDPDRGFAPAPGLVKRLVLPAGPGIRVDTGVATGDVIPAEYDSMIAKIIATGTDRQEALARLGRALDETVVVIDGGTTNKSFLLALLDRPEVRAGDVTTGWLDGISLDDTSTGGTVRRFSDVALVAAAVEVADREDAVDQAGFFASAARGRPQARAEIGHRAEFRYLGQQYTLTVGRFGQGAYWVESSSSLVVTDRVLVDVEHIDEHQRRIHILGRSYRVIVSSHGVDTLVEVDGVSHRISRDEGGLVRAPAPGLVVAVPVAVDDVVEAGATVVVLEAMKMETAITAPISGRVRDVLVTSNVQVSAGAPLVRLEPHVSGTEEASGSTVGFGGLAGITELDAARADPRADGLGALASLRWALLGYDFDDAATRFLVGRYTVARTAATAAGSVAPAESATTSSLLQSEIRVLDVFSDISELSRNRRADEVQTTEVARSEREHFRAYLHSLDVDREGLPRTFADKLRRALGHYGIVGLERSEQLHEAAFRLFLAHQRAADHIPVITAVLRQIDDYATAIAAASDAVLPSDLRPALDRLVVATQLRFPKVGELARAVRYRAFDRPILAGLRTVAYDEVAAIAAQLDGLHSGGPWDSASRDALMQELITCPYPLLPAVVRRLADMTLRPDPLVEAIVRRYYVIRDLRDLDVSLHDGLHLIHAQYGDVHHPIHMVAVVVTERRLGDAVELLASESAVWCAAGDVVGELYVRTDEPVADDVWSERAASAFAAAGLGAGVRRVAVAVAMPGSSGSLQMIFRPNANISGMATDDGSALFAEDTAARGLHPMIAERLQMWRLVNFDVTRLASAPEVTLLDCVADENPDDQRFIALAEVRDLTPVKDAAGRVIALPELEYVLAVCVDELRAAEAQSAAGRRNEWNRIVLYAWPTLGAPLDELATVIRNLAPLTLGIGLEQVMVQVRLPQASGELREVVVRVSNQPGTGVTLNLSDPPIAPLRPHDEYTRKVLQARRRGVVYPYEIVPMITQLPGGPVGSFKELDLDDDGVLVPVERPRGRNTAAIIVGLVHTPTPLYPEGMTRIVLMGDPLKSLGSLAEPECRRIIAALQHAEQMHIPVEWFALSAGAKISMDSGVENMDWIAAALRRVVEFTQDGGEINIIVAGINVGAQPYWNAEATMLMHTKGILVMTPDGAMVLTGKQALDYSGGVSAEDNFGIGGYDRIMGPNGQAQYWAVDLAAACRILFAHYDHSYVAPGERFPRRALSTDPVDRDVRPFPHASDSGLATVGAIFSESSNAGRKKPFDIRTVIRAVSDQDHALLERWVDMRDADTGVVIDAHLGGYPVTIIGIESRPLPRWGLLNADGPEQWSAGTLFPLSSKKVARGINAASGSRPVVVLANLSGFDGSPESLRRIQLEYGAEIGRAVVNFDGPIVFCLISRYHGGAFVVFSGTLNDNMRVLAVEGSYASVIGGAPAAAVVFAGDVSSRTRTDARVVAASALVDVATGAERNRLQAELADVTAAVRSEMLGVVAAEFDAVHSIERARKVGSVHEIISAEGLRPSLIAAIGAGIEQAMASR